MNSYARVMNRLAGKPVDRIPNMSIVMMFAAKEIGVSYTQCCQDALATFFCRHRRKNGKCLSIWLFLF